MALPNTYEALKQQKKLIDRLIAVRRARNELIPFMRLQMPDITDPEDVSLSQFQEGWHHKVLCDKLQQLERGDIRRLIITCPPRHSKSETCTRNFPAWFMGRNPTKQIIVTGYSEKFAQEEFGREIRKGMQSQSYAQIFPSVGLDAAGKSAGFIMTTEGGKITITGIGGAMTGKGADLLVIDDPIKNAEQADSASERRKIWDWYMTTARTRLQPGGRILIVMTRWHEDDLVGRILNPETNSESSIADWDILHLPALRDPKTGAASSKDDTNVALWPEWQSKEELLSIRADVDSRIWSSLYQGMPTPEDGDYFTRRMIKEYSARECPPIEDLRIYQAVDFAVSSEQELDASCLVTVGVDSEHTIWILDCLWERRTADQIVDEVLAEIERYNPLIVWAEKGQIAKSIGPFMHKRMAELGINAYIEEQSNIGRDKKMRARSIRARMSMGKVMFPRDALWFEDAVNEMLKFDSGRHDDFVDALAWIGLGLHREIGKAVAEVKHKALVGTLAWIKQQAERERLNGATSIEDLEG